MGGRIYRVVVAGELGPRFARAFDAMQLTVGEGQSEIKGVVHDRAQLRGLLDRVDALGLTLLSVNSEPFRSGADPSG
jgi:hypothetical protein